MLGPKGSISLEMKDDEAHSIWNMFSNWCSDVTKEKEKENKKLKKEADKLLKATRKLEKVCGMPKDSMAVYKDPNADPNASIAYGNLAPVVTTGFIGNKGNAITLADPLQQLQVRPIFPSAILGGSLKDINLDNYTYEELREIVFGDGNKAELTEETIEKILDRYPTFFDEQDLELADHDSDKRVSKLFKEKPMAAPSDHLYIQNIKPTKSKKRK
jgi:hypothetical protein